MGSLGLRSGMPNGENGAGTSIRCAHAPRKGITMKMIQALVKKFKPADNLAGNAWPYHVI
ncbi:MULTISPECIES: hypothetical protein [unclassified Streptomyces]|uniref:hypothetical protein n=1 Tax=unclassified Streptomyces TaxID=2593676 RepID=UPI00339FA566|nr:hypothetical protein OG199_06195 [Streptomyces sp. NBC_01176]